MTDDTPPGMPRWVKVFVIIVILLILLIGGFMLFSGGEHGPGNHAPGMLTGFALLANPHAPELSAPEGDTTPGDAIPSEGDHE